MFTLYPAIDIREGRCVRLNQGRADAETAYFDDPIEPARRWKEAGASWIHVVDLDGAFKGEGANFEIIRSIATLGVPVQTGGGIRSLDAIDRRLEAGVSRVVIGTRACGDGSFLEEAVQRFGADRLAVGIDARDGRVAVRGWVEVTDETVETVARRALEAGIRHLIHTDIATDGMLSGPNLQAQERMASLPEVQVIASGGVSSVDDLRALEQLSRRVPGLVGVIIGKALYDGRLDLQDALHVESGINKPDRG